MKKKILILSSLGGGGHISASAALKDYLGSDYDIKIIYPFIDIFRWHDLTRYFFLGKVNGEDIYNWLLHKKFYRIINGFQSLSQWYFSLQQKSLVKVMTRYLKQEKPDLIISVIPIVNGIVLAAASKTNTPLILIPTDLDGRTFIHGLKNPQHKKFRLLLSLDSPLIKNSTAGAEIAQEKTHTIGFPLRQNFFASHNIDELKKKWHIPSNKPVILLMMGGQGSESIICFLNQLQQLSIPAHIVVCIGKCERLRPKIKSLKYHPQVTKSIVGFTSEIAELMAIADLIITKSGSVSYAEALYSCKPILLDGTTSVLRWEKLNHELLEKHQFGIVIKDLFDTAPLVTTLLTDKEMYQTYRNNLHNFEKKQACEELPKIVKDLLNT